MPKKLAQQYINELKQIEIIQKKFNFELYNVVGFEYGIIVKNLKNQNQKILYSTSDFENFKEQNK